MARARFEGFSAGLFQFLSGLAENNSREWFDEHRRQYEADVLSVVKSFVAELGPIMRMLNDELETEPRVGRTLSRINNDLRFNRNRPPYRPFIYVSFPRRGLKSSTEALLYAGIYRHGISIGFYAGGQSATDPVQEGIRKNLRLFQRYLDERRIAESYWELAGGEEVGVTKWPLPKTARRWMNLDSLTVGEYFPASDRLLHRRSFLDRAQKILLDLYPLWLFATSEDIKNDLDLYGENAPLLARPLTKS
ncbi:MAG TPA: DUF2461 family protein, partial [Blastocatellia bacterium]|nr:DUF2461 family protein [Blastocatellia bacterium]